jgi:hypothetical protein
MLVNGEGRTKGRFLTAVQHKWRELMVFAMRFEIRLQHRRSCRFGSNHPSFSVSRRSAWIAL